jgi:hypothetical protein
LESAYPNDRGVSGRGSARKILKRAIFMSERVGYSPSPNFDEVLGLVRDGETRQFIIYISQFNNRSTKVIVIGNLLAIVSSPTNDA